MFQLALIILLSLFHLEGYSDSKKKDQHKKPVLEKLPPVEKKPNYPYEQAISLSSQELENYKNLFKASYYVETHSKTGETLVLASKIFNFAKGIENFSPSVLKIKKLGKKIANLKLHAGEPKDVISQISFENADRVFFHNNYYSSDVVHEILKKWKAADVLLISDIERTACSTPENSIRFAEWIQSINPSLSVYYIGKDCLIFDPFIHQSSISELMKANTAVHFFSNKEPSISKLQEVLEAERFLSKYPHFFTFSNSSHDYTFSNLYLGLQKLENNQTKEAVLFLKKIVNNPGFSHWRFSVYLTKAFLLEGKLTEAFTLFEKTYKMLSDEEKEIYRDLLSEELFWSLCAVEKKPSYSYEHVVSLNEEELKNYQNLFNSSCYIETHAKTGETLILASKLYDFVQGIESFSPNMHKYKKLASTTTNITYHVGEPIELISTLSIDSPNGTFFHNNYYSFSVVQEILKKWKEKDVLLISDIERTECSNPDSSIRFLEQIKAINPSLSVYFIGKDCLILNPNIHRSSLSNLIKANTVVHCFKDNEKSIPKLKEVLKAEHLLSQYPLSANLSIQWKDYPFLTLYKGLNSLENGQYKESIEYLKKIVTNPNFSHWRFEAYLTKALFFGGNAKEALRLFKNRYKSLNEEEKDLYLEILSEDLYWTLFSNI